MQDLLKRKRTAQKEAEVSIDYVWAISYIYK